MTDNRKKLNEAFRILSAISVSGSSVESMAAAKAILREIYQDMEQDMTEQGETDHE